MGIQIRRIVSPRIQLKIEADNPRTALLVAKQGPEGIQGEIGPQGPPGPSGSIVDTGTYSNPSLIVDAITLPTDGRTRLYLKGATGIVIDPTLPDGTGTQELYLMGGLGSDVDPVQLFVGGQANLQLAGDVNLSPKVQLTLHWIDDLGQWVENGRNNVFV